MPITFLDHLGPPGNAVRKEWLSDIYGGCQGSRSSAPAAKALRIARPAKNEQSIADARAYYGALWPRVHGATTNIWRQLLTGRDSNPLEMALAEAEKAAGAVMGLLEGTQAGDMSVQQAQPHLEAVARLLKACDDLEAALDSVHGHLKTQLKLRVCQPRVDARCVAFALSKLCAALVMFTLAVFCGIPGLNWTLAAYATALTVDAAASLSGEALRIKLAGRLPAALHLYPTHREALRGWVGGIRQTYGGIDVSPAVPAGSPPVNAGFA